MPEPQTAEPLHPDSDYAQIVSALRSGNRALVDAAEEGFKSQPPEVLAEFNRYIQRQAKSGDPNTARSRATGGGELAGVEGMKIGVEDALPVALGAGSAVAKGAGALAQYGGGLVSGEASSWLLRRLGVPSWAADMIGIAVGGKTMQKIGSVRSPRGPALPPPSSPANATGTSMTPGGAPPGGPVMASPRTATSAGQATVRALPGAPTATMSQSAPAPEATATSSPAPAPPASPVQRTAAPPAQSPAPPTQTPVASAPPVAQSTPAMTTAPSVRTSVKPPTATPGGVQVPAPLQGHPEAIAEFTRLVKSGKSPKDALMMLIKQLELTDKLQTPTAEVVQGNVAARNSTGRWDK